MREIKFRAWDKKEKRWNEDVVIWTNGNLCTLNIGGDMNLIPNECKNRFKICLYTGLKDMFGYEIYNGDIIEGKRYGKTQCEVVKYENLYEGDGWIVCGFLITLDSDYLYGKELKQLDDVKIIGNIYENPELVRGQ